MGPKKKDCTLGAWILVVWSNSHFSVIALGAMDIRTEVQSGHGHRNEEWRNIARDCAD